MCGLYKDFPKKVSVVYIAVRLIVRKNGFMWCNYQTIFIFVYFSDGKDGEFELPDAIQATAVALNLCLSNQFVKAQQKLQPW